MLEPLVPTTSVARAVALFIPSLTVATHHRILNPLVMLNLPSGSGPPMYLSILSSLAIFSAAFGLLPVKIIVFSFDSVIRGADGLSFIL